MLYRLANDHVSFLAMLNSTSIRVNLWPFLTLDACSCSFVPFIQCVSNLFSLISVLCKLLAEALYYSNKFVSQIAIVFAKIFIVFRCSNSTIAILEEPDDEKRTKWSYYIVRLANTRNQAPRMKWPENYYSFGFIVGSVPCHPLFNSKLMAVQIRLKCVCAHN